MSRALAAPMLLWALLVGATAPAAAQSCMVSTAGSINFMTYNPASGAPTLASAAVTLTCTNSGSGSLQRVAWNMLVSDGSSGDCKARAMPGASESLNYNIYQNSIAGGVWGNLACGTFPAGQMTLTPGGGGNTRSVTNTLYGLIPAGQFVGAGAYTENLLLTISF